VSSVVAIFLVAESPAVAFEGDNLEKFNKGKVFIYENVGEGIRSLSNLEKGIALLEELLKVPNEAIDLHRSLADGYRTIALHVYKRNTQGRVNFFEKEKAVLELAVELEPNNTDLLRRYSLCFRGEERARISRRILAIDENNEEALASLGIHNALTLDNKEKGIELARKAYDLADDFAGKKLFGSKLSRILSHSGSTEEFIEFRMQYLADTNELRNPGQSEILKITLETDSDTNKFRGDMPFAVVFTNSGQSNLTLPKHDIVDLNVFRFEIYPEESPKPMRLRNSLYLDETGPEMVEIEPGETFRIETKLSDLFPTQTTRLVGDGGYIMFLRYASSTREHFYSAPLRFSIKDFINNETAYGEDDLTLVVESNDQGIEDSGGFSLSLIFTNNTNNVISIYDQEAFSANLYTIRLQRTGVGYRFVNLPRQDRNPFNFENFPRVTISPGEQYRFDTKFSDISPDLASLEVGIYELYLTYHSNYDDETVFNGTIKGKPVEFSVKSTN